jgi:hypothetical protein
MKRPSRQQANQDSDLYYGYKGGIASLLLAVCDIIVRCTRFTYVGAPACVGDAGLFLRSRLHNLIKDGLMRTVNVLLYNGEGVREEICPHLVGDAAFPLGEHMIKAIEPPPAADMAEAEINTTTLLARRVVERPRRLVGSKEDGCFARGIHFGANPSPGVCSCKCVVHCTTFWKSGQLRMRATKTTLFKMTCHCQLLELSRQERGYASETC